MNNKSNEDLTTLRRERDENLKSLRAVTEQLNEQSLSILRLKETNLKLETELTNFKVNFLTLTCLYFLFKKI